MRTATVVLLGLLTAALAQAPTAQVLFDDFDTRYPNARLAESTRKWDKTSLTYYFQNGTADISGTAEYQAFRDGLAYWSAVTPLTFTQVSSASAADIVVQWVVGDHGDGSPFDNGGTVENGILKNVLAHAFPPPTGPGQNSLLGDVHFDDFETWTTAIRSGSGQPIDLVTIAAHEIGHSLGLGHTTAVGALMRANYTGSQRSLSQTDVDAVQSLYGPPPDPNVPRNLSVVNLGATTGSPKLQWTAPSGGAPNSYKVYRSVDWNSNPPQVIATVTTRTYTDAELQSSHLGASGGAIYTVTAVKNGAESAKSNEAYAFVKAPGQPFASGPGAVPEVAGATPATALSVPDVFAVHGVGPNPVRGSGTLRVDLPEAGHVTARAYDTLGRLALTVEDGERSAGRHALAINVGALPAGLYVYRVDAGASTSAGTFTVIR